jgi:hypothetical protein
MRRLVHHGVRNHGAEADDCDNPVTSLRVWAAQAAGPRRRGRLDLGGEGGQTYTAVECIASAPFGPTPLPQALGGKVCRGGRTCSAVARIGTAPFGPAPLPQALGARRGLQGRPDLDRRGFLPPWRYRLHPLWPGEAAASSGPDVVESGEAGSAATSSGRCKLIDL